MPGDLEWMSSPTEFRAAARMMGFLFSFVAIGLILVAAVFVALGRMGWLDLLPGFVLIGLILGGVLLSSIPKKVGVGQGTLYVRRWGKTIALSVGQVARVDLILNPPMQRFGRGRRVYEPLLRLADGKRIQLGPYGREIIWILLRVIPMDRMWIIVYTVGRFQPPQVLAEVPLAKDTAWESA